MIPFELDVPFEELSPDIIGGFDYKFEIPKFSGTLKYSARFGLLQITYVVDGKLEQLMVTLKEDRYLRFCARLRNDVSLEELKLELMIMGALNEDGELPKTNFTEA